MINIPYLKRENPDESCRAVRYDVIFCIFWKSEANLSFREKILLFKDAAQLECIFLVVPVWLMAFTHVHPVSMCVFRMFLVPSSTFFPNKKMRWIAYWIALVDRISRNLCHTNQYGSWQLNLPGHDGHHLHGKGAELNSIRSKLEWTYPYSIEATPRHRNPPPELNGVVPQTVW